MKLKQRFEDITIYVHPASGDSGVSLGAAIELSHNLTGESTVWEMETIFYYYRYSFEAPSINLSYSPKGVSYFKSINEEKYCLPLDAVMIEGRWDTLRSLFDEMWKERVKYNDRLLDAMMQISERAAIMFNQQYY